MRLVLFRFFSLFLAFTLIFFLLRVLPGDYLDAQIAEGNLSPQLATEYRQQLGLDQPLLLQYVRNIGQIFSGDFGISIARRIPVSLLLEGAVQATFQLAVLSLGLATVIGLLLGSLANSPDRNVARVASFVITIIQATPVYWVATWFIIAAGWLISPASPLLHNLYDTQLPVLTLGLTSSGGIARVTQSALQQAFQLDAIRTARAKGLRRWQIFIRHVLRLAFPSILTVIGLQAGFLLSGTFIIEAIFARPGVGSILYDAVLNRDYPVVQAVVLLSSILYVAINLVLDVLQSWSDPRIRSVA
jgi:peptide/nickel transport system permease protein